MTKDWINIKHKTPRQGVRVLVFWKNYKNEKRIDIAVKWNDSSHSRAWHFVYYDINGGNRLDDSQVTHWMPLPKQPPLK